MKFQTCILPFVALSLTLNACTPSVKDGSVTNVSASLIDSSNLPENAKAEEFAKAAEKLLTAQGFSEADQLATKALEKDPKNLRGGFIKVLLAPIVLQKGIVARIKPLAERVPQTKKNYENYLVDLKNNETLGNIRAYVLEGPADISTETQLQDHLDKIRMSLQNLRLFAREHKNQELTVEATTYLVPNLTERYARACEIKETANLEWQLVCPGPETRTHVTLARADWELLQYFASYLEMAVALGDAYDLTGAADVAKVFSAEENPAPEKVYAKLLENPKFGTLRGEAALKSIQAIGLEFVGGLRWISANQKTLCPTGEWNNPRNRVGMWVNTGVCLPSSYIDPMAEALAKTFKGEPTQITSESKGVAYTASTNYVALFNHPPKDLRAFGKVEFNACGSLIAVEEKTFAGVFPDGDANKVLPLTGQGCEAP
jgi:hypothetical protein